MKKYASITLLSICLTVIAFTSVNSRQSGIPIYNLSNIADTTPTTHHTTTTKHHTTTSTTTSPSTTHQTTTAKHHTTHHSTKTPMKDSAQKK